MVLENKGLKFYPTVAVWYCTVYLVRKGRGEGLKEYVCVRARRSGGASLTLADQFSFCYNTVIDQRFCEYSCVVVDWSSVGHRKPLYSPYRTRKPNRFEKQRIIYLYDGVPYSTIPDKPDSD